MKKDKNYIDELSLLAKHVEFKGNIKGAGDLKIDGRIEGDVILNGNLYLTEGGEIKGNVESNNFQCNGYVEGNIYVKEKFTIGLKSKINGNIKTKILIVEEGAEINGNCIAAKGNFEE